MITTNPPDPLLQELLDDGGDETEFIFLSHKKLPNGDRQVNTNMLVTEKMQGSALFNALVNNAMATGAPEDMLAIARMMVHIGTHAIQRIESNLNQLSKNN